MLRGRFLELAPEGFEEAAGDGTVELAAYGESAERVLAAFPEARVEEVEAGWEHRWREFHRPVRIGRLWVGPPWDVPPAGAVAVVVDPGQAFGTGAHPTTQLCLELLLEQPRGGVLDVGCGSGVLAIAAALLAHGPVTAVDTADASIEATRANARANGVLLTTRLLDASMADLPKADLVLANISRQTVEVVAARIGAGRLVASGYLATDAFELDGFRRLTRREREGWAADLFEATR